MPKPEDMLNQLAQIGPSGHALALQILGNREDAADAVQDALCTVLDRRSFDPSRGEFRAWFLTIVRNRCVDLLRRRSRWCSETVEAMVADTTDPLAAVALDEIAGILQKELMLLDAAQREILVLRDYLGLSYGEVATVLSVPSGTVMSRLHRARMALSLRMKRYDE